MLSWPNILLRTAAPLVVFGVVYVLLAVLL